MGHISFEEISKKLKSIGVKNHDFHLLTIDKDLIGVDPYSPYLSVEQKRKIDIECMNNYWYFLREVVRIPDPGNPKGKSYEMREHILALHYAMNLNLDVIIEGEMLTGKTIAALSRYLWIINFGATNTEIRFLDIAHADSKLALAKLKTMKRLLPDYMQGSNKIDNQNELLVEAHNRIITTPGARSKESADNIGRACTQPIQMFDNFTFAVYNQIIHEASLPAYVKSKHIAQKHGRPYGRLFITYDREKLETDNERYAYQFSRDAVRFDFTRYDHTETELRNLIDRQSAYGYILIKAKKNDTY